MGGLSAGSFDSRTGNQGVMDALHVQTHKGKAFSAAQRVQVATLSDFDILIQTALKPPHMIITFAVSAGFTIEFFEGSTFSAAGTPVAAVNRNRISSNTAVSVITHTPTITGVGSSLGDFYLPGGSGGNAQGAAGESFNEWILAQNEVYLARFNNPQNQTQDLGIALVWYEL